MQYKELEEIAYLVNLPDTITTLCIACRLFARQWEIQVDVLGVVVLQS